MWNNFSNVFNYKSLISIYMIQTLDVFYYFDLRVYRSIRFYIFILLLILNNSHSSVLQNEILSFENFVCYYRSVSSIAMFLGLVTCYVMVWFLYLLFLSIRIRSARKKNPVQRIMVYDNLHRNKAFPTPIYSLLRDMAQQMVSVHTVEMCDQARFENLFPWN